MNKTYHNCGKIRKEIDSVLHKNAMLFQNSVPNAKKIERENLKKILHLDKEFVGFLLDASDD